MNDIQKGFNAALDELDKALAATRKRVEQLYPTEPILTTPPGIKFWTTDSGIVLGLLFNENKQLLKYHQFDGVYEIQSANGLQAFKVQECLPMTPCEYGELKPGDFCGISKYKSLDERLCCFRLVLPAKREKTQFAFIDEDTPRVLGTTFESYWKIGK